MNDMNPKNLDDNEKISALVDGQLSDDDATQAMQALALDDQALARWHAYHLVGDVLRSQELSWGCAKDVDFLTRLRSRLSDESTCAVPVVEHATPEMTVHSSAYPKEAANDASLRWRWATGLASLALFVALGWGMLAGMLASPPPVQLAQPPLPVVPSQASMASDTTDAVLIRDPRLDQLLQAHRQFGGASALQIPSGFVRNATFDRPSQ